MKNTKESGSCIKIKNFQYTNAQPLNRLFKSRHTERNPIKIVVDKMGADGFIQQEIIDQNEEDEKELMRIAQSKMLRSPKHEPESSHKFQSTNHITHKKEEDSRSFVFNRFQYDNYKPFSLEKAKKQSHSLRKLPNSNNKNIQIVFCETKLPNFVQRTNEKIEQIFKKQQLEHQQSVHAKLMSTYLTKEKIVAPKRTYKVTLANSLKQYGTLEKLSTFMETDQNLRQKCLCYGVEKDPSRTVLLDIITHRFSFMKNMSKRTRENIYRSLLGRNDINPLTKINIQEYMRFTEMFIGRESSSLEVASFMYILLFGQVYPSYNAARYGIQQLNGPLHKQRAVLQQFDVIFQTHVDNLIEKLSQNEKLLRLFIDLIIQK